MFDSIDIFDGSSDQRTLVGIISMILSSPKNSILFRRTKGFREDPAFWYIFWFFTFGFNFDHDL